MPHRNKLRFSLIICFLAVTAAISTAIAFQLNQPLVVDKSEISINQTGERVYQNLPFTGEAVKYHPSGAKASAEQFLNGRRHGYIKKWFANGGIAYEANHLFGEREGFSRSWWTNGNLRSETNYVNDKAEGIGWQWYSSGEKFKRFNYVAGQPSGMQQGWRLNGKLFTNFEYKDGRIYGLRKANTCYGLEDEVVSPDYYKNQESLALEI